MTHDFGPDHDLTDRLAQQLLDDIELRQRSDVGRARELAGVRLKATLTIRPANVVDRGAFAATGTTTELRTQAALCMFPVPVMVGSMFQVEFARGDLDVPPVFAVCDRCAMLGDASFEVRLRFVADLPLPESPDRRGEPQ